jgi:hypothetical protein
LKPIRKRAVASSPVRPVGVVGARMPNVRKNLPGLLLSVHGAALAGCRSV